MDDLKKWVIGITTSMATAIMGVTWAKADDAETRSKVNEAKLMAMHDTLKRIEDKLDKLK